MSNINAVTTQPAEQLTYAKLIDIVPTFEIDDVISAIDVEAVYADGWFVFLKSVGLDPEGRVVDEATISIPLDAVHRLIAAVAEAAASVDPCGPCLASAPTDDDARAVLNQYRSRREEEVGAFSREMVDLGA